MDGDCHQHDEAGDSHVRCAWVGIKIVIWAMRKFVLAVVLAVAVVGASAQDGGLLSLRQRVDSVVMSAVRADLIPGAVVQIARGGRVVYVKAYGYSQKYDFGHRVLQLAPAM